MSTPIQSGESVLYDNFVGVEGVPFAVFFRLVLGENRVFVDDYVTTSD